MIANAPMICWSCRGPTPAGLFCATCRTILPPVAGEDFFQLFDISPSFEPDLSALERRYRDLQKQLHPDFFAHRSGTERRLSLEWTTRINEAWQTLSDPVARAGYLLRLAGWHAERPSVDPAFLEEVMELREALESVDPRAADAIPRLATLKSDARRRLDAEVVRVADLFRGNGESSLAEIVRHVDRMRYHRRYLEELDRLEDRAFDP
ncbi:Co-chaperone protein HscB [Candidatus Magnetaquicoccaceae bacterium FCR-1]|uniref:Co-chaperone protein HscB homolog n=1 Tax=Candidatus Magnetaquiglobus chichijimensis TaxID=3141448 RepID=A0ABQ0C946_9PROT